MLGWSIGPISFICRLSARRASSNQSDVFIAKGDFCAASSRILPLSAPPPPWPPPLLAGAAGVADASADM